LGRDGRWNFQWHDVPILGPLCDTTIQVTFSATVSLSPEIHTLIFRDSADHSWERDNIGHLRLRGREEGIPPEAI
jgi:hypothetical protein